MPIALQQHRPNDDASQIRYLTARLTAVALEEALPLSFADNCWNIVETFIAAGLKRMQNEGKLNDAVKIQEATSNLRRFIHAMRDEAARLDLDTLHEPTADRAMRLCPLWPFC